MVDYVFVPIDCYKFVSDFRVVRMNDIVGKHSITHLITDSSRLPDHSLLSFNINCTYNISYRENFTKHNRQSKENKPNKPGCKNSCMITSLLGNQLNHEF